MDKKRQCRLAAVLTASLLAVAMAGCSAPQPKAETQTDMSSEPGAKTPGAVEITQGTVGGVGDWPVGVANVDTTGSVKKADLSVSAYPAGVPAEFDMKVAEHALVPFGDGLHQILWIVPETEKQRGRVGIASEPIRQQPSTPGYVSVYIVADGRLLVTDLAGQVFVNGPDVDKASDIEVTAWHTGQSPASVDVLWKPARYTLQDTDPKDIQHAHLEVGNSLNIRGQVLTVRAIEPQTAEHPAWVRFEMVSSGPH